MPNQYTKFRSATECSQPREFKFRQWDNKRGLQRRSRQKNAVQAEGLTSGDDRQVSEQSGVYDTHTRGPPCVTSALLQYLPSGGLRIDPFRSFPVKPNHAELGVLDYFLHILAPGSKHNDGLTRTGRTTHVDPHINLLLPFVMQEPPLFDAMLACCQASISLSSGLSAYSNEFFILHRGRAMSGLRKQLENNADVSAMLAVTMLITCDYLTGDIKAVAGHSKALQRMVALRGQLPEDTAWNKFVKDGVQGYSMIANLATGRSIDGRINDTVLERVVDPFSSLEYPQPPFSAKTCDEWTNLPPGFLNLIFSSQLSTQLITIIEAVNTVDARCEDTFVMSVKETQPLQAALQRFSQHTDVTYLERCIAAGLLAYSFQFPRLMTPNLFHDPPMQGMIRLLSVSYRARSTHEKQVLAWVHMAVEAFLAARPTRLSGSRDVFTKAMDRYNIMKDWSRLVPILQQFFWTPELLERWWSRHAAELESPLGSTSGSSRSARSLTFFDVSGETTPHPAVCPFSGETTPKPGEATAQCPFSMST